MDAQERLQFLLALQHPHVVTSYMSQSHHVMEEAATVSSRNVSPPSPTIPPFSLPTVSPPSPTIPPFSLPAVVVQPAPPASPPPLAPPAGFTIVPADLVDIYTHHQDIIEDLLPSCEQKNWSAAYKAYKQVELVLFIAAWAGLTINYGSSSVMSPSPHVPTLERMISGLRLTSGVYGTFQNKLTLYFRVITFLEKCEQVQAETELELPANMLYCYRQCSQWHEVEPKDLSSTAPAFTNANPVNSFKKQLANFIVSSFFVLSNTTHQMKFRKSLQRCCRVDSSGAP
jgi:hypothetical protein